MIKCYGKRLVGRYSRGLKDVIKIDIEIITIHGLD
jgi:hypothetical protein